MMEKRAQQIRPSVLVFLQACLVLAIYANTLHVPFIFDDIPNIRDNLHLHLTQIDLESLRQAAFESPLPTRPVAYVSFALNWFFHGDAVAGYHLVNLAVHLLTGLFLWLLLTGTAELAAGPASVEKRGWSPSPEARRWICFWAVLIWLVHPLHTQTVTYIVQRMNGLAALFFIVSLFGYLRARTAVGRGGKMLWGAACGISAALAMGSKEIAATLPFFIFLYEWYFFQDLKWEGWRRKMPLLLVLVAAGAGLVWIFLGADPLQRITGGYAYRDFTLVERVWTQFRVVLFYITLLLFPHPSQLNLDYDFPLSHSLVDPPSTLAAFLFIVLLAAVALTTAMRHRVVSFCILWFLGNLVIESSVVGLEIIFEHRTYLPSMAFCLLAAGFVYRCIRSSRLRITLLAAVVAVLSFWTYERNGVWQDDLTLWTDCAAKSPNKARPNNKAGVAMEKRGRIEEAEAYYWKALVSDPDDVYAYYNLGNIARNRGHLAEAEDFYRKAIHLVPENKEAHLNLGVTLVLSGRLQEGMDHMRKAIAIDPDFALAHRNLGGLLWQQGKVDDAMAHLRQALRVDPADAEAHYLMGNSLLEKNRVKEAFSHYVRALRLRPDYVEAHNNLGVLLFQAGRPDEAAAHFQRALELNPGHAQAKANLERIRD